MDRRANVPLLDIEVSTHNKTTILPAVPYYPFSGRLRETGNGKLEVFFGPDQGVLFIEASTKMELESLGDLSVPNPAYISLIFEFPNEEPYKLIDMPLLIAQVTHPARRF
ncbi:hypothetical protein Leryth_004188 [Lithospermum erythrorhizon]|nr:hypothetical protein Leryth_004188 [Lithospermum erythrorhizon]